MTIYRRLTPAPAPIGAPLSILTSLVVGRFRHKEQIRQTAALDEWEDEGGSVMATDAVAPAPGAIDPKTGARFSPCGTTVMGQPGS